MQRETTLAGAAVLVVLLAGALALTVPGATADVQEEDLRPSHIDLRPTKVKPASASGQQATLSLDVRLQHRGGPAENVTIEIQAIDRDTGMVETTKRKHLGNITATGEVQTWVNITVRRQGGYRIYTRVYEDGRRIASGRTSVSGVGSLVPSYADAPVEFHRFETGQASLPVITFGVARASNDTVDLRTETYLTNRGSSAAGGLEVVLMARQVDSNIIADRETVQVGQIAPGRTVTPSVTLTVPDEYNYHLDAILRKDGVIVGTATAPAMLDPSKPIPENQTRQEVDIEAGEFAQGTRTENAARTPRPAETGTAAGGGPGFGVTVTLASLLAIGVYWRRTTVGERQQ